MSTEYNEKDIALIWKHTHPDFRGNIGGKRYILVNEKGATVSSPITALSEKQFQEQLKYAKSCEQRGRKGY